MCACVYVYYMYIDMKYLPVPEAVFAIVPLTLMGLCDYGHMSWRTILQRTSLLYLVVANLSHTYRGSQSCKARLWGSYNTCFIKMLNSQFLITVLDYSKPSLNLQKGPFHAISFGFDSNKHVNGQKQCIIILPAFLNSEIRLSKLLQQMISIKSRSKKGNSELKDPVFLSHYFCYAQISHKL